MKNDPTTWILGSTLLAFLSATIGLFFGGKDRVTESECKERREACDLLITVKLKSLEDKLDVLIENNRTWLAKDGDK